MSKVLSIMIARLLGLLAPARAQALLADAARRYVKRKDPKKALEFLLGLDQELYALHGRMGKAYGGGEHPKHRLTAYHDFFVSHLREGERVLDVGCGRGELALDMVKRADVTVIGIDMAASNIELARRRCGPDAVTFVHGDVCSDMPPGHYDVIVLSNVLEHIEDRVQLLKQLKARATPDRFLVRVPSFDRDWRVPLRRELGLEWRLDMSHETEYTQESFQQEMDAAGLRLVYCERRWGEIWAEAAPGRISDDR